MTIVALVVIASLSANSLSSANKLFSMSHDALVAMTTAGFVFSVVGAIALIKYLRKSTIRVSDYTAENKGLLYAIKDDKENIKGYLFGTVYHTERNWKHLDPEVEKIVRGCGSLLVCHKKATDSITAHLIEIAEKNGVLVDQYETATQFEETETLVTVVKFMHKMPFMPSKCSYKEALDRRLFAWKTGNEKDLSDLDIALGGLKSDQLIDLTIFKCVIAERNTNCMSRFNDILKTSNKPIFISIDTVNIFNYIRINKPGLQTLLTENHFKIERIETKDS